jgi:hypothetical protein
MPEEECGAPGQESCGRVHGAIGEKRELVTKKTDNLKS